MGKKIKYVSVDRIISKLYRDLGIEEMSETDIIEQIGEALEGIGAITLYEEALAFAEVKDHHADIPCGLHDIIQIARNNFWSKKNETLCPAEIICDAPVEEICEETEPVCGCVSLDCYGNPIPQEEIAVYRPYFDLQYEYSGWMGSRTYIQQYTPVRLSNHTFFNSLVCKEDNRLYTGVQDEYTIVADKLRFSFKEGSIAIAYHRQVLDPETGYPMIPDDYSVITAITMYITMKYMARLWYMGREGYGDKYQKAEQDWHWYCKQAGNNMMITYGDDEFQRQLDASKQMIPNSRKYYGYFGRLGVPESNAWKTAGITNNFTLRGIHNG